MGKSEKGRIKLLLPTSATHQGRRQWFSPSTVRLDREAKE